MVVTECERLQMQPENGLLVSVVHNRVQSGVRVFLGDFIVEHALLF